MSDPFTTTTWADEQFSMEIDPDGDLCVKIGDRDWIIDKKDALEIAAWINKNVVA